MGKNKRKQNEFTIRPGLAKPHGELVNNSVHVFVDDQNLFWGAVNDGQGHSYRIDFGRLLTAACRGEDGKSRFVKSAYIAGVIPDDDSFWKIAENKGFTVRRGYLSNSGGQQRSKQDDAYLITEITSTLYEQEGPSTIVLVAGDADYVPPLIRANEKSWCVEVAFIARGLSSALDTVTHQFRTINLSSVKYIPQ
jgi:uncharacterized LabA/DUF88 family protein